MYIPKKAYQALSDPLLINPMMLSILAMGFLVFFIGEKYVSAKLIDDTYQLMSVIIPSIHKWVELSPFPNRTVLIFIYVWLMVPVQIIFIVQNKEAEEQFVQKSREKSLAQDRKVLRGIAFLFFIAAWMYIILNYAVIDTPPCRVCVNSSPFWQVIAAELMGFVTAGLISVVIWWLKNLTTIYKN